MRSIINSASIILVALFILISADLYAQWTLKGSEIKGELGLDGNGSSVSLSLDGNIVAIGSPANNFAKGHVRVFKLTGGVWTKLGGNMEGYNSGDQAGYSVSLSSDGSVVAFGAPYGAGGGGVVRIFKFMSGSWIQIGELYAEADGDNYGFSVSLSGDGSTVAIGAPFNMSGGFLSGIVQVYKFISISIWIQVGANLNSESAGDLAGYAVSLSSNGATLAIGAIGNDGSAGLNRGHVRVYKNSNGSWVQQGPDIDGESPGDGSGRSVSLSSDGNTIAIGAIFNAGNGVNQGHVRVYKYTNAIWIKRGADIDGEANEDRSGWSVSLSMNGTTVAIGAPNNEGGGMLRGQTRVYKISNDNWIKQGPDIDGEALGELAGYSVSLSGNGLCLAVGAPFVGGDNTSFFGKVRVYSTCSGSEKMINSLLALLKGGNKKLVVCHNRTTTLKLGYPAILEHLMHGDLPGACGTNTCSELEFRGTEWDQFIIDDKTGSFELYPNPAQDFVNVKFSFPVDAAIQIQVYNSLGQLLWIPAQPFKGNSPSGLPINLKQLPKGVYFIKVSGKGFQETKPFTRW